MRSVAASHRAVRPHTGLCFQVTAEQQHDCKQTLTPKDLMQVCPVSDLWHRRAARALAYQPLNAAFAELSRAEPTCDAL